jgi:hypothetical protein
MPEPPGIEIRKTDAVTATAASKAPARIPPVTLVSVTVRFSTIS